MSQLDMTLHMTGEHERKVSDTRAELLRLAEEQGIDMAPDFLYHDVYGANVKIHDHQGYDVRRPRLTITFNIGVPLRAGGTLGIKYEVDILKTIKHDIESISSPAILPVIRRWQTFIRMYFHHEGNRTGRAIYKCARTHLQEISPLALKAAQERALPKEYALRKHLELSGDPRTGGGPDFEEERFYLGRACFFMSEDEFKESGIGYIAKVRLRQRFSALQTYLEDWAKIRAKTRTQQLEREAELRGQRWSEKHYEEIEKRCFVSMREVLRFFERDLNLFQKMPDREFNSKSKKSILMRERTSGHDPKLEIEYLAWRFGMSGKKIKAYLSDKRMAEHIRQSNSWFSPSRPHIPKASDLPEAPFEYPDIRLLQNEFSFPASMIVPRGEQLEVYYKDNIGRHQQKAITLILLTKSGTLK